MNALILETRDKLLNGHGVTKEEVTDWFNIEVWDKQAEFAGEYIKKGRQVVVDGRISISKWTDQSGDEEALHQCLRPLRFFGRELGLLRDGAVV